MVLIQWQKWNISGIAALWFSVLLYRRITLNLIKRWYIHFNVHIQKDLWRHQYYGQICRKWSSEELSDYTANSETSLENLWERVSESKSRSDIVVIIYCKQ